MKKILVFVLILLAISCTAKEQGSKPLVNVRLELTISNRRVSYVEPVCIETRLVINNGRYIAKGQRDLVLSPLVQIRRIGAQEWKTLRVLAPGATQLELSHPDYVTIILENNDEYIGNWAVLPWKANDFSFAFSKKDSWYYYEPGQYEIRAVYPSGKGKKGNRGRVIYSNIETFEVVEYMGKNQEVIEYISSLQEPRFLFDFYMYDSYSSQARFILENFADTNFATWALLYVVLDELYSLTPSRKEQLIGMIEKEKNPFLKVSGKHLLNRIQRIPRK